MSQFSRFSDTELRQLQRGLRLRVGELHGIMKNQDLYSTSTRMILQDIDAAELLEARVAIEIENR